MKVAVTYQNGQVFQHFGHTEEFKIYTVQNDEVKENARIIAEQTEGPTSSEGVSEEHPTVNIQFKPIMFIRSFLQIIVIIISAVILMSFSITKKRPKDILYAR